MYKGFQRTCFFNIETVVNSFLKLYNAFFSHNSDLSNGVKIHSQAKINQVENTSYQCYSNNYDVFIAKCEFRTVT
jgi:hypothetical protein